MSLCFKKRFFLFFVPMIALATFAYNPGALCDNYFQYVAPETVYNNSVTGGALMNITSASAMLNPALIANEQRWAVDLDYSAFIPSGTSGDSYGQAGQVGLIIPSKVGNFTAAFNFFNIENTATLPIGSTFTFRTAYAKDLTSRLYLGIGLYGGWGNYGGVYSDYCVAADIGFWYLIKTIQFMPFLSNVRWAVALTGLGKSYTSAQPGIYNGNARSEFPSPFTLRAGIAADLCDLPYFKTGISFDIAFPTFQNFTFGVGLQFLFANIVRLSVAWEGNVREMVVGKANYFPVVGLSAKFNIGSKKKLDKSAKIDANENADNFITKHGWEQNECEITAAYKNMNGGVNLVSASATFRLGTKDEEPPQIFLWDEEAEASK